MKRIITSRFFATLSIILLLFCATSQAFADTYIVAVGINRYKATTSLHLAEGDAKAMASLCKTFPDAHVSLITGRYATRKNIKTIAGKLFENTKADDTLIFYFSGHGAPNGVCAYDSPSQKTEHLLSFATLASIMKKSPARRKIIISDSCFSGGSRQQTSNGARTHNTGDPNILLFMSSRANETSIEIPSQGHSIFTYHLINGLKGAADTNSDRRISASELFRYVSKNVQKDSKRRQHPVMWGNFDSNMTIISY